MGLSRIHGVLQGTPMESGRHILSSCSIASHHCTLEWPDVGGVLEASSPPVLDPIQPFLDPPVPGGTATTKGLWGPAMALPGQ